MDLREKLHAELKEFIANVGWTHKIHIVQSDRLMWWANAINVVQIVSSAITASGLLAIVLGKGSFEFNIIIAIISFITLVANGLDKAMDLRKLSTKEKQDANNFWKLRESGKRLLSDVQFSTDDIGNVKAKFDELIELRNQYNDELLNVPSRVVTKASKLLKERKDNDYSDDYQYFIPQNMIELKEENK